MMGDRRALSARNHSAHSIREIKVPDDGGLRDMLSLPKLMRGEVRVSEL